MRETLSTTFDHDTVGGAAAATKKQQTTGEKEIIKLLTELGGGQVTERDIVFEGSQIKLPTTVSKRQAMAIIKKSIEAEEEHTSFNHTFSYRPWDGAYCMQQALLKAFGTAGFAQAQMSMFGSTPPQEIAVKIGAKFDANGQLVDETVMVPWGTFAFPILDATITTGGTRERDRGTLFVMIISGPKKNEAAYKGLFKLVENELAQHSIYRGKAFDGSEQPSFIDPYLVNRSQIVYTDTVMSQLEANVWSMLRHRDAFKTRGLSLKRSVLLEGSYGVGKSVGAMITAQEALENGWTFIQCRPGADDLRTVMQTAKLYQPAVVFFEDIDIVANTGDPEAVTQLLDLFDGISAKGTELLMVLTTNHPENIHKGMLRPGRLDARIKIEALDSVAREKMIKANVKPEYLADDLDFVEIGKAMEGYLPSFVKEAISRAQMYALARTEGKDDVLHTEDFVMAAVDVRWQYDAMLAATGVSEKPKLEQALGEVVKSTVTDTLEKARFVNDDGNADMLGGYEAGVIGMKVFDPTQ